MKKILILAFVLAGTLLGCKERANTVYRGIPDGVHAACHAVTNSGDVLACVGEAKAYSCVRAGSDSNETHEWRVFECARVSAPVLPEEPKGE